MPLAWSTGSGAVVLAKVCLYHRRMPGHGLGRSLDDRPPIVEDQDTMAELGDRLHHVLDHHDRDPELVDVADERDQPRNLPGHQPRAYLIQEEQLRLRAQSARQVQALEVE